MPLNYMIRRVKSTDTYTQRVMKIAMIDTNALMRTHTHKYMHKSSYTLTQRA